MKIKLVIWDLDETLWSGTIDNGDNVVLNESRVAIIRNLNNRGVINSICSKNDKDIAIQKLKSFGIWDEFVFSQIEFLPKGQMILDIIHNTQLRAENVLFIDDNPINLAEIQKLAPTVNVLDARQAECDISLAVIVNNLIPPFRSRVVEYRALEARHQDRSLSTESHDKFLYTCNIRVCVVHQMDNLDFIPRIEELVNRSNQLNYTKSRIPLGTLQDYIVDVLVHDCFSIFAWDKYGYHGLVGFIAVDQKRIIRHFAFSCRIMHLGIEQWSLEYVLATISTMSLDNIALNRRTVDWIKIEKFQRSTRAFILENEKPSAKEKQLRIMANCQSGALSHYSGLSEITDYDNMPRFFNLGLVFTGSHKDQNFPKRLVYGAFNDYATPYWPEETPNLDNTDIYEKCAREFQGYVTSLECKMLVFVPPIKVEIGKFVPSYGMSSERTARFNEVWEGLSNDFSNLSIIKIDDILQKDQIVDVRHYTVDGLKKLGEQVRIWYERN